MPLDEKNEKAASDGLSIREILTALEFFCWTSMLLLPILIFMNGAAVSRDQAIVRIGLAIFVVCGAIGLRLYHWQRPPEM